MKRSLSDRAEHQTDWIKCYRALSPFFFFSIGLDFVRSVLRWFCFGFLSLFLSQSRIHSLAVLLLLALLVFLVLCSSFQYDAMRCDSLSNSVLFFLIFILILILILILLLLLILILILMLILILILCLSTLYSQ